MKNPNPAGEAGANIESFIAEISALDAASRIRRALDRYDSSLVLNSSFGPQSIICLKLALDVDPGIPVVMIELPGPEYAIQRLYRDYLKAVLGFDLYIVQASGIAHKKSALCEFLHAHGAHASLSGIRWQQTETRAGKGLAEVDGEFPEMLKIYPIADWADALAWEFVEQLPAELRHPGYARGQRSIGGVLIDTDQAKLECGLHV